MPLVQHITFVEDLFWQWPTPDQHDYERGYLPNEHQPLLQGDKTAIGRGGLNRSSIYAAPGIQQFSPTSKISSFRRGCQIATAVLACWLASGIVFGFAALKLVLIAEGVFHEYCDEGPYNLDTRNSANILISCPAQESRLNLVFIAGSITTNLASLPAGATLDRFGRRLSWIIGCIFLIVGSLFMGLSFRIANFKGYLVGNMFLGLGGTFIFVPSFQLSGAFPKYSGLVIALITGGFDASASVFLFYRLAYESFGNILSPDKFFIGYIAVPVFILVAEFSIMPSRPYHSPARHEAEVEDNRHRVQYRYASDYDTSNNKDISQTRITWPEEGQKSLCQLEESMYDAKRPTEQADSKENKQETAEGWGVLHSLPAYKQMRTTWFMLLFFLTALQMLRMNYFIATIRLQYRFMLGSDEDTQAINHFFDAALPIGGVLSTPLIGLLLSNLTIGIAFSIVTVFISAIGALNCISSLWAGYATVVAFVIFRPLYYSAISDCVTKLFGLATFGRIYGALVCFSGLATFAESAVDALTQGPLQGDPTAINASFTVAGTMTGIALIVKAWQMPAGGEWPTRTFRDYQDLRNGPRAQ